MAKKEHIVRYSAEELAEMRRRGQTHSDWERAAATTYEEIEAQIAADPDEAGMIFDWESGTSEMPKPRAELRLRIDRDVLDFFRSTGRGYQSRINAVLRHYVQQVKAQKTGD
jgi:uncharacterized protein (DUF4415 family)